MIQGFYTAKTTLVQKQKGLNVIANNIANVNTDGFKKSYASFEDALYYEKAKNYPQNISSNYKMGSGAYISSIERNFSQGVITETNRNLDIALDGQGFFCVADESSNFHYTRGGSFNFSLPDNTGMKSIVNEQGYCLVDENGDQIKIPQEINDVFIDGKGVLRYDQEKEKHLMIVNFSDATQLEAQSGGMYLQTNLSGEPISAQNVMVRQGFLEMSNVDTAFEMVELIKAQRVFEMNSKVIQTIDIMQSQANRLRK